jgi:hypothetical protein
MRTQRCIRYRVFASLEKYAAVELDPIRKVISDSLEKKR